jgi:hypothetical protein
MSSELFLEKTAQSLDNRSQSKLRILEEVEIKRIGYEMKRKVKAVLIGSKNPKPLFFIERVYNEFTSERRDKIIEVWKKFKEIGLPVVPTLRMTKDRNLLVTDVKVGGWETFGKGLLHGIEHYRDVELPEQNYVEAFLQVIKKDVLAIKQQALEYAEIASSHGVQLPWDDPFELMVNRKGEWKLMILDLGEAELKPFTSVSEGNRGFVDFFMDKLERLADYFEEKVKKTEF